jgi:hypothetical protein
MEIFTKNSAKCTIFQSNNCNNFSSLMWEAAALELEAELNLSELLAGVEIDGEALEISSLFTQSKDHTNGDNQVIEVATASTVEMNTDSAGSSESKAANVPEESPFFFATM